MSNFVKKNVLMDADAMRRAIVRISHEIIEKNKGVEDVVLVGIHTLGVPMAERLAAAIEMLFTDLASFSQSQVLTDPRRGALDPSLGAVFHQEFWICFN